jgi:hypothetical protein
LIGVAFIVWAVIASIQYNKRIEQQELILLRKEITIKSTLTVLFFMLNVSTKLPQYAMMCLIISSPVLISQ